MERADRVSQPQSDAQGPAPAASPATARRWGRVFPEPLGVGMAAVLLAGLIGAGAVAQRTLTQQGRLAQQTEGQAVTRVFAAALGHLVEHDDAAAATGFQQLCGYEPRLRAAEWLRPDGSVRCRWPEAAGGAAPAAGPAPGGGQAQFSAPVPKAGGGAAGTLRLTFHFGQPPLPGAALLRDCAVVGLVALLGFLALYRLLRRHLRPLDAIQRNLHSYASGLEREFVALSLSDSLGHIAQCWNHMIDQVQRLREQGVASPAPDPAGDALRRFESRMLLSLLDRLPLGLLRFGADQRVTYANAVAGRLLGRSAQELVGLPLSEVLDEDVRAPLVGAYSRATAAMSIDRKRGPEEQQTTLRFGLIPAPPSCPDCEALVTIEDVSHLQEADRARDNFLYHVTHELRTPLTNIQAYAETLTGPGFDDEQTRRECYNVIISETRRLSRLVEDILNVSQLEVGTARIEVGEVDLVRLLRQIVQDHLGAADEKQIDLTLKLAPKVPKIQGDKQRLSVLITNLVGNALKYTPNGGRVAVTLEVHERSLEIAVADNGIGIAPEDQPHVFEKFYRAASPEVQAIKGTGLGLAIAREVARLHGGDIRLESTPGQGSKFTVELPLPAGGG